MDGTFAPGYQLGESRLAEQMGVSRGPVREALQRLVQEGLLQYVKNRGACVISLGPEDVADVYLARGAIERAAALTLMRRGSPEDFEALEGLVQSMSDVADEGRWSELAELDMSFHETLVGLTGSPRLRRMFTTLLAETRMCLADLESAYPVRKELVEEHRGLLCAMRDGEETRALAMVDSHLGDAVRDLTGGDGYRLRSNPE
ncbi:MAG: GntR family transcriptional regulator [Rubrobacter sp.]|nr:GntR family transcriptional regulator [Rubrobacter sp.]